MADDTDDSGGVIFEGPFDPDAQATVTDFIDYTEYLPSDLIRSLTLIRGLDETYLDATQKVHELTKIYGQLPDLPPESRRNPQELREQISTHLNRAINAREASYAEACRIYDEILKENLSFYPNPASRDATPPAKRSRGGRKAEKGATRITLRVDGQTPDKNGLPKSRGRRSMIAGLDPDSPIASTEQSDNETPKARSRRGGPVINPEKEALQPKKEKKRGNKRLAGAGTNVHSSVAGISTSNALALLKPPPEDAKLGSDDLPWLRLTDWEMTKLRKKMKKNAIWQPSEIMINRELATGGRGWEGYRAAKARAQATGEELIDCDDIENTYVPGKLIRKSEATADISAAEEIKTSNRGMILNEAKRLKRENMAREQEAASAAAAAAAAAAAEAELAAKRISDIGSTFKRLFSSTSGENNQVASTDSAKPNGTPVTPAAKGRAKITRKRKAEESLPVEQPDQPLSSKPPSKKRNTGKALSAEATGGAADSSQPLLDTATASGEISGTKILKPSSSSPPPTRARSAASHENIPQTTTLTIKGAATPTPPTTRPSSRRRSAATSMEPGSAMNAPLVGLTREHLRRKSVTPASKTPGPDSGTTAAGTGARRKKRPAPGPVSSSLEGGATLSHGKRKSKPKKRAPGKETVKGEDYRIDEDGVLEKIDPNEPRYCLCKDVSFGTMINCENPDCEGEWFHLECIGLKEPPSRRAKWFCPECRVKLKKAPDGIERVGGGRR
ncbi:PHD finger domain protein, putative [Talaromyces stipitatus ATCC 10500]|uniref:PHD finger domain protein, putative n=1 Tax=Talaromyces stipitatus (strain ATCC 10500 / CBS 375.48 / QM 6759 / NRRL 1006) TaxID=441959 RepID=B8M808_TALSN|nr:PHD finger domain protein, putative [Talaromyces stipitatus ATCC 10500]EED19970.1 PHD finger domain protein, putative [Talaromyces stipitatus ATCC 10500]